MKYKKKNKEDLIRLPPIPSADYISDNGAVELVAAVLRQAHDDYIEAIRWIKANKTEITRLKTKIKSRDKYDNILTDYKITLAKINNRIKRNPLKIIIPKKHEREIIRKFKTYKTIPEELTKKERDFYNLYLYYDNDIKECELFWKSPTYEKYTLGRGIPAEELIPALRKEANNEKKSIRPND